MAGDQPVLMVISGPVGVGKTTIGSELSSVLERQAIAHSFIDLDGLTNSFPRNPDDPFGSKLALANLSLVWTNFQNHGSKNLIVARVMETPGDGERLSEATGIYPVTICQLHAPGSTLLSRVRKREIGSARDWHERRALELAGQLEHVSFADFRISTEDRLPTEIAQEIATKVAWAE